MIYAIHFAVFNIWNVEIVPTMILQHNYENGRNNEKRHNMKMNLMLRQWTDSALWKNPHMDINHRALIHFPQYQMPIRPIFLSD